MTIGRVRRRSELWEAGSNYRGRVGVMRGKFEVSRAGAKYTP